MPANGVAVAVSSETDEVMILRRNGNFVRRSVQTDLLMPFSLTANHQLQSVTGFLSIMDT